MGNGSSSKSKGVKVIKVIEAKNDLSFDSSDDIEDDNNSCVESLNDDGLSLNSDNTIYLTSLLEDYSNLVSNSNWREIKRFMKGYVGFARLRMPTTISKIRAEDANIRRRRRSPAQYNAHASPTARLRSSAKIYGVGPMARRPRSITRTNRGISKFTVE